MLVSTARLHSVLKTAVDGIIVIDDSGTVLVFNDACVHLFGYERDEVIGKNVSILMSEDDAKSHDAHIKRYLDTGEKRIIGQGREVSGCHKDGSPIPIELSVGEADTSEGHQFIGIIRDLRARKAFEQRVRDLQSNLVVMTRVNALDEMGAAIAHEINQPLTAVMLYLQTAARRMKTLEEQDPQLLSIMTRAVDEADRASKIIQRMRSFVEKQEPQKVGVNLASLIDECVELVMLGHKNDNINVISNFSDHDYNLTVDAIQVQQILVNLIRNACEAIKDCKKQEVYVDVDIAATDVFIKVTDTGPGLCEEVREQLFKAFTGTKRRGLGVGLAISRSIAQNHGGDLFVEPYVKGKGATFVLRLPLGLDGADGQSNLASASMI